MKENVLSPVICGVAARRSSKKRSSHVETRASSCMRTAGTPLEVWEGTDASLLSPTVPWLPFTPGPRGQVSDDAHRKCWAGEHLRKRNAASQMQSIGHSHQGRLRCTGVTEYWNDITPGGDAKWSLADVAS